MANYDSDQIEKRKETRFTHRSRIFIENIFGGEGLMLNFSQNGFYFESDKKLELDKNILVGIVNSPYNNPIDEYDYKQVRINRIIEPDNSRFKYGYGVKIIGSPTGKEKSEFRKRDYKTNDSRKYERKEIDKEVFFVYGVDYFIGFIQNISKNGMFIKAEGDFRVDEFVKLTIPKTKYDKGTMIKAKIVRVDDHGIGVKVVGILKSKSE